jgi:hypothetical protein
MDRVRAIMFRATFKNISAISWWSVLLVGETEVPGENHRPFPSDLKYFENKYWVFPSNIYMLMDTLYSAV